jgi:hypothetical protein
MGKLCPKGKAAAKRKFKVYPSAYANMYASAVCSGKVTPGGKKDRIKKADGGDTRTIRVKPVPMPKRPLPKGRNRPAPMPKPPLPKGKNKPVPMPKYRPKEFITIPKKIKKFKDGGIVDMTRMQIM